MSDASPTAAPPADHPGPNDVVWRMLLLVVALGGAIRLANYAARRSLWLDEAMLALNVVGRSFVDLLRPLSESQAAPWLFLIGERAAVVAFGPNEFALRVLPLVTGLALPWVTWHAARRMTNPAVAVAAAAVVALSPLLVYYANEVKPYELDALVTVVAVYGTLRMVDNPAFYRAHWWVVALGGVVALWCSFPSVFVLGACGAAIFADRRTRGTMGWSRLSAIAASWSVGFAVPYVLILRAPSNADFLQNFFASRFLIPWSPLHLAGAWQELSAPAFLGRDVPGLLGSATAVLCLVGAWTMIRARAPSALLVLGPLVLGLIASTFRLYPMAARLWAFAVPLGAVLLALGLRATAERFKLTQRAFALALFACLLPAMSDAAAVLADPFERREHLRPLIHALRERQRETGEPVYIMPHAVAQWRFYATDWNSDGRPPLDRDAARTWLESRTCGGPSSACQLLGRYSNVRYTEGGGYSGGPPTRWAMDEIGRLRHVSHPCGWLLLHHPFRGEPAALAQAIASQNGRLDGTMSGEGKSPAFRVCFREP